MIVNILFVLLFVVLSFVFLAGKGDKLIAGYNTASEEEKKQVDIRRLRLMMALISVLTACFLLLMGHFKDNGIIVLLPIAIGYLVVILVLAIFTNIWSRKK